MADVAGALDASNLPVNGGGVGRKRQQWGLTRNQIIMLLRAVAEDRIDTKQGKSYIPQWEARATMNRIFGPGNWDSEVIHETMIYETKLIKGDDQYPDKGNGKPYYVVAYKVGVRATIRDLWGNHLSSNVEYHVEENAPLPNRGEAHAMALTSATSYALRRALINFGDALGLHLYNKGGHAPVILQTLALSDPAAPGYKEPQKPQAAAAAAEPAAPAVEGAPAATQAVAAAFNHPEGRQG